jgi:D-sedoheptulose 7-phosphate isomerase
MSITAGPERGSLPASALTVLDTRLLDDWGQRLAATVRRGGRLLIAASGGSAAQAEQLAAQLNSWAGTSRAGRPAIVLHAEASAASTGAIPVGAAPAMATTSVAATAPASRGYADELARQVREHGRPGDVLLAMSVSGRGRNLVRAVAAARAGGIAAWCLTGPAPNQLADNCDDVVCVYPAGARALALSATVREAHQVALHLICLSFDAAALSAGEAGPHHHAV